MSMGHQLKKPIEFCCISCSTVHDSQECPACGSKMKQIYEENIWNWFSDSIINESEQSD